MKGVSLYLAIIIVSILLTAFIGLTALIVIQLRLVRGVGDSVVAFYAADSGIEKTLDDFAINIIYCNSAGSLSNGSSYEVSVTCNPVYTSCPCPFDPNCDAPRFCILSQGIFQTSKRAVEVDF